MTANARSVVVDAGRPPARNSAGPQRLADAECAKHQRVAKLVGRPRPPDSNEYIFECVL